MLQFFKKQQNKNVLCAVPFRHLHIYEDGYASFCCYSWQPHFIGNIKQNSIAEILQTAKAQKIRESVSFGDFKYCREDLCPALVTLKQQKSVLEPLRSDKINTKNKKMTLYLNYDKSCNLTCSSCRNELIYYKQKNIPASLGATHEAVLRNIKILLSDGYDLGLNITGSGDAFASELYSNLMNELAGEENIHFNLQTNGILMNEQNISPELQKKIRWINVSVDATTADTYAKVRRGGRWSVLLNNLQWMNEEIVRGSLEHLNGWQWNFIVQEENYHEIPEFLDWALAFSSKPRIWFNLIDDWGHLPSKEFQRKAIWRSHHPQHQNFLEVLAQLPPEHSQIIYGNMLNYLVTATSKNRRS